MYQSPHVTKLSSPSWTTSPLLRPPQSDFECGRKSGFYCDIITYHCMHNYINHDSARCIHYRGCSFPARRHHSGLMGATLGRPAFFPLKRKYNLRSPENVDDLPGSYTSSQVRSCNLWNPKVSSRRHNVNTPCTACK